MMSSITLNDKTLCTQWIGEDSTSLMTATCEMEYGDTITYSTDTASLSKNLIMNMLEKLDLAEAKLTYTATASGYYNISADCFNGIRALRVS